MFVVTPTTQTQIVQTQPNALGSSALLTVPPNAVTQSIGLTVQPAALPPATDVSALVGGTAYELGPSGTTFAAPITVAVQYAPAGIPARMAERRLRLFTLVGGAWQLVPGSVVDPVTHTVSGTTSHFSTYGVLASASVSAGSFASCGTGTSARTVCWGDNIRGEVGANSTTGPDQCSSFPCSLTPTLVANADTFVVLSVGGGHACGVTPPPVSAAQCWGASYFGQLGNGPSGGAQLCGVAGVTDLLPCSTTAVTVSGGLSFASVSTGANHTCGVTLAVFLIVPADLVRLVRPPGGDLVEHRRHVLLPPDLRVLLHELRVSLLRLEQAGVVELHARECRQGRQSARDDHGIVQSGRREC